MPTVLCCSFFECFFFVFFCFCVHYNCTLFFFVSRSWIRVVWRNIIKTFRCQIDVFESHLRSQFLEKKKKSLFLVFLFPGLDFGLESSAEESFDVVMDDLSFNFNSVSANRGSSLFKFASFKHSTSKEKLDNGVIPLEYIIEELEDGMVGSADAARKRVAEDEEEEEAAPSFRNKKALPKRNAKKKREEFSDDDDDMIDEEEDVDEDDAALTDGKRNASTGATSGAGGGGKHYVDITEYLCLPQSDAAVKLGLPGLKKKKKRLQNSHFFFFSFHPEQKMEGICQDP